MLVGMQAMMRSMTLSRDDSGNVTTQREQISRTICRRRHAARHVQSHVYGKLCCSHLRSDMRKAWLAVDVTVVDVASVLAEWQLLYVCPRCFWGSHLHVKHLFFKFAHGSHRLVALHVCSPANSISHHLLEIASRQHCAERSPLWLAPRPSAECDAGPGKAVHDITRLTQVPWLLSTSIVSQDRCRVPLKAQWKCCLLQG